MALSEIMLLVVAVFAFGWMVQMDVGVVSGAPGDPEVGIECVGSNTLCDASNVGRKTCLIFKNAVFECAPISEGGENPYAWSVMEECSDSATCESCECVPNAGSQEEPNPKDLENDYSPGFFKDVGKGVFNAGKTIVGREAMKLGSEAFNKAISKLRPDKSADLAEARKTQVEKATKEVLDLVRDKKYQEAEALALEYGLDESTIVEATIKDGNTPLGIFENSKLEFLGAPVMNYVASAVGAASIGILITFLANKYSSERNAGNLKTVTWIGAGVGTILAPIIFSSSSSPVVGLIAAAIVLVFASLYMITGYQLYSQQIFTFYPSMWQPDIKTNQCERCNDLEINDESVCSEYLCHSYGAACEWVNDETDYETCTETGQGDKTPPILTPLIEAYGEPVFSSGEFRYVATSAGAKIVYDNPKTQGCVPAYTPLLIALETNENAHCKISLEPHDTENPKDIFEVMMNMQEGTVFTKTHTLSLPSSISAPKTSQEIGGYTLSNGGNYVFYIRCMDIKGNVNDFDYSMGFCVDIGPDFNPPEIIGTNPEDDSFISYGVENIENFEVYTNEPAICKWDFEPKNFEFMSYDFIYCSQNVNDLFRGYNYGCRGNLTRFKPGQDNGYYVACMDQPGLIGTAKENQRNAGDPVPILLKGSQELVIQDVRINGQENNSVIREGIEPVNVNLEVLTFGGAEEGKAKCQHSNTGTRENDYALFYNDGSMEYLNVNFQELYLVEGDYKYYIRCGDIAGNIATSMVNFNVEIDSSIPSIVRVYKEGNELKLVTNEESACYYSTFSCTYDIEEDGTEMSTSNGVEHTTEWNTESDLYIKCIDIYGARPNLDQCSLIARPFEVTEPLQVGV